MVLAVGSSIATADYNSSRLAHVRGPGDLTTDLVVHHVLHQLPAGTRAQLPATDPPYCVGYTGAGRPQDSGKDWSDKHRAVVRALIVQSKLRGPVREDLAALGRARECRRWNYQRSRLPPPPPRSPP